MNMIISDIKNMLLQTVPVTEKGAGNFTEIMETKFGFAASLKRAVGKLNGSGKEGIQIDKGIIIGKTVDDQGLAVDFSNALFQKIEGGDQVDIGIKVLAGMEKALLKLAGGNLEKVSISTEGLDALQELLTAAGFEADEVTDMITGLKEKSEQGSVSLKEVMDTISPLRETDTLKENSDETEEVFLETSSFPFITALLDQFELPKDEINHIVKSADNGQKGISLNTIFDALIALDREYRNTGVVIATKDDQGQIAKPLMQMSLPLPESAGTETVSLKDLLSAFDSFIQSKADIDVQSKADINIPSKGDLKSTVTSLARVAVQPIYEEAGKQDLFVQSISKPERSAQGISTQDLFVQGTSTQKVFSQEGVSKDGMVDRFFASLTVENEKVAGQTESFYQQVKDQFKNDLFIPEKGKQVKNGLFANTTPLEDPKADPLSKIVTPLLTKHRESGLADTKHEFKAVTSDGKTDGVKTGDVFQSVTTAGKSDSADSMFSGRAKSSDRPLPSYVTQQVNKSIVRAVNNGETSLKLQLKPVALGRLTLIIDNSGNSIKVSIITEHQSAKDMLTANVGELRTVLQTSGISLDSFDVNMGNDFKQSMADAGNQAGQFRRNKEQRSKRGTPAGELEDEDMPASGQVSKTGSDGAYHFVA